MSFIPNINVITSDDCKVYVEDTSIYLPETSLEGKHRFKYSDTVSIDVLRHNKLTETVNKEMVFSDHSTRSPIQIPVNIDGWFSVVHVVLPSEKWFNTQKNKQEASRLDLYDFVYFSDGVTVFKYNPKTKEDPVAVPVEEILLLNLEAMDYTVYITEKDYVSICFLRKCYINLCQLIFNDRGFSSCLNKNAINSELVYKRDLTWMTINVIKYLTECELLAEVERIIENIQGCNGLCNSSNITSKTNGCGCSK